MEKGLDRWNIEADKTQDRTDTGTPTPMYIYKMNARQRKYQEDLKNKAIFTFQKK